MIAQQGGERIRFFLLSTHYRSTVVFGEEGLAEASTALESFYRFFERFQKITKQRFFNLPVRNARGRATRISSERTAAATVAAQFARSFLEKMDDDFNTGGAIADLFDMVRELNKYIDRRSWRTLQIFATSAVQLLVRATKPLRELTAILGLFRSVPTQRGGGGDTLVPKLMKLLIELRAESRAKKDFAMGDKIRKDLTEMGITLEDKKGGRDRVEEERVAQWKSPDAFSASIPASTPPVTE